LGLVFGGLIVTFTPLLVGLAFGAWVLRMNPVLLLGGLSGAMTMTPAMAALQNVARSPVPVLGLRRLPDRPDPADRLGQRHRQPDGAPAFADQRHRPRGGGMAVRGVDELSPRHVEPVLGGDGADLRLRCLTRPWLRRSGRCSPTAPFTARATGKVWARLRHAGLRTSKERVRRLMRENGLSATTRPGRPRGPRPRRHDHPGDGAGQAGRRGALRQRRERRRPGLAIRHDHGSQYMSRDFQREIAWLGAFGPALEPMAGRPSPSPAFVRAPEGNGCAERFIRTLKENLLRVRTFRDVEELRLALIDFRQAYNERWLIERHGHRSPAQIRRDQMDMLPLAA
jgi:putative transposase